MYTSICPQCFTSIKPWERKGLLCKQCEARNKAGDQQTLDPFIQTYTPDGVEVKE